MSIEENEYGFGFKGQFTCSAELGKMLWEAKCAFELVNVFGDLKLNYFWTPY